MMVILAVLHCTYLCSSASRNGMLLELLLLLTNFTLYSERMKQSCPDCIYVWNLTQQKVRDYVSPQCI